MFPAFIIMFREALEAALVLGIILGFLVKTGRKGYIPHVSAGAVAGVVASILVAFTFQKLAGGLSDRGEELFEGLTMITAAALITTVVFWMRAGRHPAGQLKERMAESAGRGRGTGLFFLSFFSILREGVESVIFLSAAGYASDRGTVPGALAGLAAALLLGFFIYEGSLRIDLGKFFTVMGVILLLFAAGLVAQGVHELVEAGVLHGIVDPLWNLNPEVAREGSYPIFHERGTGGGLLKGLFGYNGDPSLMEVVSYALYVAVAFAVWGKEGRRDKKIAETSPAVLRGET